MHPLPIIATIVSAYRFVWDDRHVFARVATVPVVVLALAGTMSLALFPDAPLPAPNEDGQINPEDIPINLGALFRAALSLVFYVMFAVAWHRKWLLPKESVTVWSALRWDARKFNFLWRLIAIVLLSMLGTVPITFLVVLLAQSGLLPLQFGVAMILVVVLLIFSRLSVLLPASAIDVPMGFKDCWLITRGNGFRLLLIVIVPTLPVSLLHLVAVLILHTLVSGIGLADTLTGTLAVTLFGEIFRYIGIAVGVSALSISYQHFQNAPQPQPPSV